MYSDRLTTADYKDIARDCLKGHWIKAMIAAILAAVFGAFSLSLFSWVKAVAVIAGVVKYLETMPQSYARILPAMSGIALFHFFFGEMIHLGYIRFNLSILDKSRVRIRDLFSCYRCFWKAIFIRVVLSLLIFIGSLFFLLPGLYVWLAYAMTPYVLEERPGFPVTQAMTSSRKMMRGFKLKLLWLKISFLGWDLLNILTFGLAFLYVVPYKMTAEAVFYNEMSGRADAYYGREQVETLE